MLEVHKMNYINVYGSATDELDHMQARYLLLSDSFLMDSGGILDLSSGLFDSAISVARPSAFPHRNVTIEFWKDFNSIIYSVRDRRLLFPESAQ